MRSDRAISIILCLLLTSFCAKPKTEWLKWQESLDLPYPDAMTFNIDMENKVFYEGEPLIFRMSIINDLDIPQTIIHLGDRTHMIGRGYHTFMITTELDLVLRYSLYILTTGFKRPEDAVVVGPCDTVYCYAILNPDLFFATGYPRPYKKTLLGVGNYTIESRIHLGTKFYPKPARALNLISNPTEFRVTVLPAEEHEYWIKVRPYFDVFFGSVEESFFPFSQEVDRQTYVDSALYWLEYTSNSNSLFAPYADFVYTCIPAITRRSDDAGVKIDQSIINARRFIEKYEGSVLGEEMEFKLAWWLFYKDSTNIEFYSQAGKVIEKYPKNLNSYGIKKILNGGL